MWHKLLGITALIALVPFEITLEVLQTKDVDNSEGPSEHRFAGIQNPNPQGIFISDHDFGT